MFALGLVAYALQDMMMFNIGASCVSPCMMTRVRKRPMKNMPRASMPVPVVASVNATTTAWLNSRRLNLTGGGGDITDTPTRNYNSY